MRLVLCDERDGVPMTDILLKIREECLKHRPCSLDCMYHDEAFSFYGDSVCVVENIIGSAPIDWWVKCEEA